ncbi:MAG: hypothetical protein E5X89_31230 [Mesorhizobium sp.]|nr:MAG: hypothetical protein E5X89_31230 [Mesorhizobium sp.]
MRKVAGTAAVIASIALVIVLLFMAPKGFELSAPNPLVSGCVRQVQQKGAAMKLVMRLGAERASCARAGRPC